MVIKSLICFSLKSQNELNNKGELKNQISLGLNNPQSLFSNDLYPLLSYTIHYKRIYSRLNFKSGINYNFFSLKDFNENEYVFRSFLLNFGLEKYLLKRNRNQIMIGSDFVLFDHKKSNFRTYGWGINIVPSWQFLIWKNFAITTGLNLGFGNYYRNHHKLNYMDERLIYFTIDKKF